ncbi:MAG: molecular chaperone TorD family protein [Thiohalocapsa sp.]
MTDQIRRAQARSRTWQLLSLAFAHPVAELHPQFADGRFAQAFESAIDEALETGLGTSPGEPAELPSARVPFQEFEAQYITLFNTGPKGRPLVPLCAAGYSALLDGEPPPSLLLRYVQFYRHFGLKIRTGGEESELPDHLTCQLECLAWLTHLETRSLAQGDSAKGYRQAQHDFIDRLLGPHCAQFAPRLARTVNERGYDPLFAALGKALDASQRRELADLQSTIGDEVQPPQTQSAPALTQNLWG